MNSCLPLLVQTKIKGIIAITQRAKIIPYQYHTYSKCMVWPNLKEEPELRHREIPTSGLPCLRKITSLQKSNQKVYSLKKNYQIEI